MKAKRARGNEGAVGVQANETPVRRERAGGRQEDVSGPGRSSARAPGQASQSRSGLCRLDLFSSRDGADAGVAAEAPRNVLLVGFYLGGGGPEDANGFADAAEKQN